MDGGGNVITERFFVPFKSGRCRLSVASELMVRRTSYYRAGHETLHHAAQTSFTPIGSPVQLGRIDEVRLNTQHLAEMQTGCAFMDDELTEPHTFRKAADRIVASRDGAHAAPA